MVQTTYFESHWILHYTYLLLLGRLITIHEWNIYIQDMWEEADAESRKTDKTEQNKVQNKAAM